MSEATEVSTVIPATPQQIYNGWLDSETHGKFSGGAAQIDSRPGGAFTAWDGYIQGTTLELDPPRRILQSWRSSDFPEEAPDSLLEVLLEPAGDNTCITIRHTNIPDGQAQDYRQGWMDYYFEPMQAYFGGQ